MFEIIPGILEQDWQKIEEKLERVKPFATTVHIDLLDGKFAKNTTWLDPKPFKKYAQQFTLELHLMVDNPIQYVAPFAEAGFRRFIGHIEKMPDQVKFVAKAEALGEVGLALDTKTGVDAITVPLEDLDCLLVMTVPAGFSGQEFQPEQLEKLKQMEKPFDGFPIEVDGGINLETLLQAKKQGASRFVVTSGLFSAEDIEKQFAVLTEKLTADEQSR